MRAVTPALRYPCRAGRACVVFDRRPRAELVRITAVSLSQGQAMVLEADIAGEVLSRPLVLLAHHNVLGVRQWAPSSTVEWPAGHSLRLHVAGLVAGNLIVAVHCELPELEQRAFS